MNKHHELGIIKNEIISLNAFVDYQVEALLATKKTLAISEAHVDEVSQLPEGDIADSSIEGIRFMMSQVKGVERKPKEWSIFLSLASVCYIFLCHITQYRATMKWLTNNGNVIKVGKQFKINLNALTQDERIYYNECLLEREKALER